MNRIVRPTFRAKTLRLCLILAGLASAATGASAEATAALIASAEPGWPQFRGPRRDGISEERGLLPSWPEGGPRRLWAAQGMGRGFSSPVMGGGLIYLTGDFDGEVRVLALDGEGRPRWQAGNGASWQEQYKGARASVTYSAGRVYHENAHGRVTCLEAASGREIWSVDLARRFRGEGITWGRSECLLVDERTVYATVGGRDAVLAAFDKETGALRWQTGAPPEIETGEAGEGAGYASPILVRFAGRRLLIGATARHLYAADADTGRMQWMQPRPTAYAVLAMMPVLVGDAVFMTAPHGPPGRLYRLRAPANAAAAVGVEEAWSTPLDTCQGGVVHVAGRLFGSYYPGRRGWAALEAATGRTLFEAPEVTKGAVLYADDRLYVLSEDGWMRLLAAEATRFEVKGQFRLAEARARDAWAHPVILDGRLYLRYHDTLQCHDIRAKP